MFFLYDHKDNAIFPYDFSMILQNRVDQELTVYVQDRSKTEKFGNSKRDVGETTPNFFNRQKVFSHNFNYIFQELKG